jgi:hypothetical protein
MDNDYIVNIQLQPGMSESHPYFPNRDKLLNFEKDTFRNIKDKYIRHLFNTFMFEPAHSMFEIYTYAGLKSYDKRDYKKVFDILYEEIKFRSNQATDETINEFYKLSKKIIYPSKNGCYDTLMTRGIDTNYGVLYPVGNNTYENNWYYLFTPTQNKLNPSYEDIYKVKKLPEILDYANPVFFITNF